MTLQKKINLLAIWLVVLSLVYLAAWTYTWDTTTPAGSDSPSVIDDRIREVKQVLQERLNVDHFMPLTGSQVSDADAGYHRDIHFYSTTAADPVLDFTTVGGIDELRYTDSAGSAVQFTSAGAFNVALLTSKTITTPTLTSPVLNTGVSGTAVLDEDDMASNSATKVATQQSIKAYVDDQIDASITPSPYAGEESITFPNGLILKIGTGSTVAGVLTVNYATPFPNAVISAQATLQIGGGSFPGLKIFSDGFTVSQLKVYTEIATTYTIHWMVWGR